MKRASLFFAVFLGLLSTAYTQSVDGALKTLTASGTNTYTISEPLPAAYSNKERFLVRFSNGNTGAATLNRNHLGARAIKKADGSDLVSGDLLPGAVYLLSYNGTFYQMVGGGGSVAWADITGKPTNFYDGTRWGFVTAASDTHIDLTDDGISEIDGASVIEGLYFLLMGQNDPAANGIYVAPGTGEVWERAPGFDSTDDFQWGLIVKVISDVGVYAEKTFYFKNQPNVGFVLDQYPENPEDDVDAGYYTTDFMDFTGSGPIKPGSVIVVGSSVTATDNGAGGFTGAGVLSGTIDYASGYFDLTVSSNQDDFLVDYIWLGTGDFPIEFNEDYTLTNSSDGTSHTIEVGGNTTKFIEGSNITLSTANGNEVTIAATIPSNPVTYNGSYQSWEVNSNFRVLGSISAGYYQDYGQYYWGSAFHASSMDIDTNRDDIINPMIQVYNEHFSPLTGYGGSINWGFNSTARTRWSWVATNRPTDLRLDAVLDVYDGSADWEAIRANSTTHQVNLRGLLVKDESDATKIADFDLSGIGTGTTRTYTLPNTSGTFALGGGTASGTNTGDQTSIVGISGTKANFNSTLSDGDFVFVGDTIAAPLIRTRNDRRTESGTTYTLTLYDEGKSLYFDNSGNITVTLPDDFPDGWEAYIEVTGTGTLTIVAETTLNSAGTVLTQFGGAHVESQGSDIWKAVGSFGLSNDDLFIGSVASANTGYSIAKLSNSSMTASGSAFIAIPFATTYPNNTIVVVETTIMAMKSDGTDAAFVTLTSMFRKDNSGTWTDDTPGTGVSSDATVIASAVGDIALSSQPVVSVTYGAFSGTWTLGMTCKSSSHQY